MCWGKGNLSQNHKEGQGFRGEVLFRLIGQSWQGLLLWGVVSHSVNSMDCQECVPGPDSQAWEAKGVPCSD